MIAGNPVHRSAEASLRCDPWDCLHSSTCTSCNLKTCASISWSAIQWAPTSTVDKANHRASTNFESLHPLHPWRRTREEAWNDVDLDGSETGRLASGLGRQLSCDFGHKGVEGARIQAGINDPSSLAWLRCP